MKADNYKVLARYPNKTLLIETGKADNEGNTRQLINESEELISELFFSGVVYINQSQFEVYQGSNLRRTGMLHITGEVDWNAETPRQKYNKAYEAFTALLQSRIEQEQVPCFCCYPRIIDYILHRFSDDSRILQAQMLHRYLERVDSGYDPVTEIETTIYTCKACGTHYRHIYRERGEDHLEKMINGSPEILGAEISELAPNFLTACFDEFFCRESFIHRERLYQASLPQTIDYLFGRK